MFIEDEIREITKRINRFPNNIAQFVHNKDSIIDTKRIFNEKYGYIPTIKEVCYILINKLDAPEKCRNNNCDNYARFKDKYYYCCRKCAATDPVRNSAIQSKLLIKLDYKEIQKKGVITKNKIGEDGLTTHKRASVKAMKHRSENYEFWYERMKIGIGKRTPEMRRKASKQRSESIYTKYGVTHFGGGYSKIKKLLINNRVFLYQGYEDVAIYELIFVNGIEITDIEECVRFDKHKFKYEYGNYYPDIFIKSQNLYIEIKSIYWDNKDIYKQQKQNTVEQMGFNYQRIIYEDKQRINNARTFLKERDCYVNERN